MKKETEFVNIKIADMHREEHAINHGAMMLCKKGKAKVKINFGQWNLNIDSFIIFYPGDMVVWGEVSNNFEAQVLRYTPEILRATSMNIEHEIYRELRIDRICSNKPLIESVVKSLFNILNFYFSDSYTPSVNRITALLIQSFFIGFADYMRYNPESPHTKTNDSQHAQQLFAQFMQLVEENYHDGNEVNYYAQKMNISRKYLGRIVRDHTGKTAKQLINDYRIQQLKLSLFNTTLSMKEIALLYHFTDQSALTRYFKAHTGHSPKEYKRSLTEK